MLPTSTARVMLTAWKRIDKMPDSSERQRMWLFVIAADTLSNYRRTVSRRLELTERLRRHLATAVPGPDDTFAVRDAVLRLHQAQRELVMLIHWDRAPRSRKAAERQLGLNPSTARGRYAAARTLLREALVDEKA